MIDEKLARLRAHRNNIHRYRRLLETPLSEIEREFVKRRLSEETAEVDALTAATFSITFAEKSIHSTS